MPEIVVPRKGTLSPHIILFDEEDMSSVSQFKWSIRANRNTFYAYRNETMREVLKRNPEAEPWQADRKQVFMHRYVMLLHGEQPNDERCVIDHVNHNGLDNRKENLRWATVSENMMNSLQRTSKSGYIGVSFSGKHQAYVAKVVIDGVQKVVAVRSDKKAAAQMRDMYILAYGYTEATLNFPQYREEWLKEIAESREKKLLRGY